MILFKAPSLLSFGLIIGALIFWSIPDNNKMGMYYFNSYQYETAYQYLNDVENFEKGDISALKKIKDYFLINGNTLKALQIQYKLIELRPHNIGYHLEAEKLCDWNKRPIEKLSIMEKRAALYKGAEQETILLKVAEGYRWLKLYKDASRVYSSLINSTNRNILESSIEYYLTKKEPRAAIKVLEKYVELFPGENKYGTFLVQSYSYIGLSEKAFWQALVQLGLPPEMIKGDFQGWLSSLSPSKIRNKWSAHSRLLYLSQEMKNLKWRDALIAIYSKKLRGDTVVLFTIGESYYLLKNFKAALPYFRKSERNPSDFRQRNRQLATYYSEMKRPKDAIRCLERLVYRYPRNQLYWELLGDIYEGIGDKKNALRAYLKLLRLEANIKIEEIRKNLFSSPLYVQSSSRISIPIKYIPKRAKRRNNKRLRRVRDKVLAVAENLKSPRERVKVYKELLERRPNDLRILKNLGFSYFNLGEVKEARSVFQRIYNLFPNDTDAQEIVAGMMIENGSEKQALELIEKLQRKGISKPYILNLQENALYKLEDRQKHGDLCSKIIEDGDKSKDGLVLKNRCLMRLKRSTEALALQQQLALKYPNDNDIILQKAFSELDAGNIEAAKSDVALLKKRRITSASLQKYLIELEEIVRNRDAFTFFSQNQFLKAEDFSYLDLTQDLRKRVRTLGFGVNLRSLFLLSGGSANFGAVSPYVSYFYKEKFDLNLGYRLGFGDKKYRVGLFARANYYGRHSFFNLTYENSEPLILTRNLILAREAYSRTLNLYWEKFFSARKDMLLLNTIFRKATFSQEDGTATQFTGEYLYSLLPHRRQVDFYLGAQLSRSALSSDGVNLNQNFLIDSLSYHLVARVHYGYQNENIRHWRFLGRVATGGDNKRGVDFGKSWQLRTEISRFYGPLRNFKFYSEYYNETVGVNLGSTFLLGLNWLHRF